MAMKLLVVGGGFTGAAACSRARSAGGSVMATTRTEARASVLRTLGILPVILKDVGADADALAAHIDRETHVLVTVPPDGARDARLAPILARANPAAVAYVSSTGVYGRASGRVDARTPVDRDAPRAAARLDAEDAWRNVGASIVRAPGIYGPGRGLHLRLARGEVTRLAAGTNAISRIHVEDLAAALLATLANHESRSDRGEIYVVADEEPAPNADVVKWICERLGIQAPPVDPAYVPDESLRNDRRVDGTALRARFGITLAYPDYRAGYADCIERDRPLLDGAYAIHGTNA